MSVENWPGTAPYSRGREVEQGKGSIRDVKTRAVVVEHIMKCSDSVGVQETAATQLSIRK